MNLLTAIPVYNEEHTLHQVLQEVRRYSPDILVVDDGSTDRTAELLARETDLAVITQNDPSLRQIEIQRRAFAALFDQCQIRMPER